jgi:hypothetical protein
LQTGLALQIIWTLRLELLVDDFVIERHGVWCAFVYGRFAVIASEIMEERYHGRLQLVIRLQKEQECAAQHVHVLDRKLTYSR